VDMLGYPVAEVAEILNISVGTVKSRCARGRARLLPHLAHLRSETRPAETRPAETRPAETRPAETPGKGNQPIARNVSSGQEGGA